MICIVEAGAAIGLITGGRSNCGSGTVGGGGAVITGASGMSGARLIVTGGTGAANGSGTEGAAGVWTTVGPNGEGIASGVIWSNFACFSGGTSHAGVSPAERSGFATDRS